MVALPPQPAAAGARRDGPAFVFFTLGVRPGGDVDGAASVEGASPPLYGVACIGHGSAAADGAVGSASEAGAEDEQARERARALRKISYARALRVMTALTDRPA